MMCARGACLPDCLPIYLSACALHKQTDNWAMSTSAWSRHFRMGLPCERRAGNLALAISCITHHLVISTTLSLPLRRYLIKSLVRKWGYEAATLLVDETWEEFTSITSVFYDPRYIFPKRDYPYGQDFNGYNYNTPLGGVPHRGSAGNPLFAPNSPTTERPS